MWLADGALMRRALARAEVWFLTGKKGKGAAMKLVGGEMIP